MKKLGYRIQEPSKVVVVTTNDSKVKPLEIIKDFPIVINHLKIPTTVEVLESPKELLLLGNDWLIRVGANLNWKSLKFTVNYKGRIETVNTTCFVKDFISVRKTIPLPSPKNHQNVEDELEENQWSESQAFLNNPAIYLAKVKR
jgi:hypothetical protein